MSYGVTAYRVKWQYVEKYVFGSRNKNILKQLDMYSWHVELAELFKGTKSITPKKAAEEIVNGVISRTNPSSGAMYRYVFEKILRYRGNIYYKKGSELPPEDDIFGEDVGRFLPIAKKMNSTDFYPIDFESVKSLFFDFEEIPLPFPSQDDFPWTSFIRYDKLIELKIDYTSLNLPDEVKNEFEQWVEEAIKFKQGIVFFYY